MDFNADSLVKLARALDVSADYLLGLTDDPRPYQSSEPITVTEYALLKAWRAGEIMAVLKLLVQEGSNG